MKYRALILASLLLSFSAAARADVLKVKPGDHVCLVGNELGERMQHHNYWETLLHQRFPRHNLVVRNLCFPGDEPYNRLRSLNFGTPDKHLAHSKASVILFFFGFNESFQGKPGLKKFTADLTRLVKETQTKNYSGKGPPRIALISPIAFEKTGDPNLPDGTAHNERLAMYAAAMKDVAKTTGVGFADVFTPTQKLFSAVKPAEGHGRWTLNGCHLNEIGYRVFATILDRALFGEAGAQDRFNQRLRREIADKNVHWWHRYRAVNGYSIYGKRGLAGFDGQHNNREVMERERAILDQMCDNRDRRIWALAQGKTVAAKVDDGNTLPFFKVKTNVGGDNDPNRKSGKLGELEYIPAEEQLKSFQLAPGYEINLVASEKQFPELANPVAMNFDNKGRLWVSTMPSYPQWQPKSKLDDKLLILEDKNRDGRADVCKVFAGGLHQPTGFELGNGGVYVAQQPDVLFLKDTNGDDKADVRIRKLVGFDTADSHHGIAAFEWGPGGGLYFQEGTFKQSQVETPDGPRRLGDAGVWRFEPKTARLDVHVSFAFANPWGHVFDRWGQNFIADASPGNNYWAAPISGDVAHPDKHPGGSRDRHLDFGGPRSDKKFPTFFRKRIRPSSGCEIVSSRHFPPEAQGNFLLNNVIGDLAVLQHTMHEDGSGFGAKEITPLVKCTHGNFRPVDLQFGPDGALYIVDWHNALIGHLQHNLRDPSRDHSHGRIWRVTYKGRPLLKPPKIAGASIRSLLDLLKEPEDRTRYRVRRELAERKTDDVIAALAKWTAALDKNGKDYEHHLLEALWMYQTHNRINEPLLERLLTAKDHRARAAATRVLSFWRDRISHRMALLGKQINDKHPRVRLEAVRACSFIHTPKSIEVALHALNHEMDFNLEYTLDETIRVLQAKLGGAAHDTHAHHGHHHGGTAKPQAAGTGPFIFLDKSPKIVAYQLKRLPSSQLLHVERSAKDAKFKPVYSEILLRSGVSRQDRAEAVEALVALNRTNPVTELLSAVGRVDASSRSGRDVFRQLAGILLQQPAKTLAARRDEFRNATASANGGIRTAAYAALIAGGDAELAWQIAAKSAPRKHDFLKAIPLLPGSTSRAALREQVVSCLNVPNPLNVRIAAIEALAHVPAQQAGNFSRVARFVGNNRLRPAAVRTLSRIPKQHRPAKAAAQVVMTLVKLAETTPPRRRTTPAFLDAMNLADELLPLLPKAESRRYRDRLRKVVVRVVVINTVHEEMRYDTPYFVAEAGRPVQVVLRNDDLMPHNLVITRPGKLKTVAFAAAGMSSQVDGQGKAFVPQSNDVLFATKLVPTHGRDVLTFTAPKTPGEYPYVCTFPNHWMRMYGVMLVVPDLEAWTASPKPPADPLGFKRQIVRKWTLADFAADLATELPKRQPKVGQRIYQEATCVLCHKIAKQGQPVGPDLTDVFQRHKGDSRSVLREILDPSHKVDPKYALYNVVTADGKVVSGVITKQDRTSVTVVSNPENPKPQVISRDDIEVLKKSSVSMMPRGIMDRFTRDEILDLLAYLKSVTPPAKTGTR